MLRANSVLLREAPILNHTNHSACNLYLSVVLSSSNSQHTNPISHIPSLKSHIPYPISLIPSLKSHIPSSELNGVHAFVQTDFGCILRLILHILLGPNPKTSTGY